MKKMNKKEILIMIIIFSFIGFIFEDMWMVYEYSRIDNRNMYLPFLFGYGLMVVFIYLIIGTTDNIFNKYKIKKPDNAILYMLLCFILVSIGEITLGFLVEKLFNFSYWNYTSIPLHITKYTSVPTSIGFAISITIFINFVFVPLLKKIKKIENKIPMFIVVFITIILLIDMSVSYIKMYKNNGTNRIWRIDLKK